MILVVLRMRVIPEKRLELSQTIASLSRSIGMEKGCRHCELYQNLEKKNELFLLEEWDTRKNLRIHLKSEGFKVLRGAMNLLQDPYQMIFHTVSHSGGMQET